MTNLVVEFSDLLQKYIDSPKILIDSVSIAMSSSCLGPLFNSTWTGVYGKPNIYILLSSIPGRTRRSSIQGAFNYIFTKVYKHDFMEQELAKPENKNLDEKQLAELERNIEETVESLLIGEGSKEGIADALVEASEIKYKYQNTCAVFNSTEFGDTMKNIFNPNSYEKGVGTIISKMYYGESHHVRLSKRSSDKKERYIPRGLYVVMCAGMQDLAHFGNQDSIAEGLQRRLTIPYAAKGERHFDPINENRAGYYPELDAFAEKVIERRKYLKQCLAENEEMINWDKKGFIEAMIMSDVQQEINNISKIDDDNVDKNPSNENLLRQSSWEHLYRISLCYEIANCTKLIEPDHSQKHVRICMSSFKLAKDFLDKVIKSTEGKYDNLGRDEYKLENTEKAEEDVYQAIEKSMPNGISSTELQQAIHILTDKLGPLVLILLRAGRIRSETSGKTKPKTTYFAVSPLSSEVS